MAVVFPKNLYAVMYVKVPVMAAIGYRYLLRMFTRDLRAVPVVFTDGSPQKVFIPLGSSSVPVSSNLKPFDKTYLVGTDNKYA